MSFFSKEIDTIISGAIKLLSFDSTTYGSIYLLITKINSLNLFDNFQVVALTDLSYTVHQNKKKYR